MRFLSLCILPFFCPSLPPHSIHGFAAPACTLLRTCSMFPSRVGGRRAREGLARKSFSLTLRLWQPASSLGLRGGPTTSATHTAPVRPSLYRRFALRLPFPYLSFPVPPLFTVFYPSIVRCCYAHTQLPTPHVPILREREDVRSILGHLWLSISRNHKSGDNNTYAVLHRGTCHGRIVRRHCKMWWSIMRLTFSVARAFAEILPRVSLLHF